MAAMTEANLACWHLGIRRGAGRRVDWPAGGQLPALAVANQTATAANCSHVSLGELGPASCDGGPGGGLDWRVLWGRAGAGRVALSRAAPGLLLAISSGRHSQHVHMLPSILGQARSTYPRRARQRRARALALGW